MKKILLLFVVTTFSLASFSQSLTTKKGFPILPEAGDWAIGADAGPFLEFVGNMFNGTLDQSSPNWDFVSSGPPLTLFGKYCKSEDMFYRGRLRIGFQSASQDFIVLDKPRATDTTLFNDEFLTDKTKTSSVNINLSGGMEFRKGKGRVQGYCGPEVFIGFSNSKTSYEFANPTDTDMTAESFAIFNFTGDPTAISADGKRITEMKGGSKFTIGVRGFVGVEIFVMSKMSIGGEFGWGIGISHTGAGETSTEYYEPSLDHGFGGIRTETIPSPGKSSLFNIDNDNANGAINLCFYFQ